MESLNVNSCEYMITFKGDHFEIGCQKISFKDANKIADFIKEMKEETFKYIRGDRYIHKESECIYILSNVSQRWTLIDINEGTSWDGFYDTKKEAFSGDEENFTHVKKIVSYDDIPF